jgi:hypothetical protein
MNENEIIPKYRFFTDEKRALNYLISVGVSDALIYTRHSVGMYLIQTQETCIFLYNWKKNSSIVMIIKKFLKKFYIINKKLIMKNEENINEKTEIKLLIDTLNHELFHQILCEYIGIGKITIKDMYYVEKTIKKLEKIQEYKGPFSTLKIKLKFLVM